MKPRSVNYRLRHRERTCETHSQEIHTYLITMGKETKDQPTAH